MRCEVKLFCASFPEKQAPSLTSKIFSGLIPLDDEKYLGPLKLHVLTVYLEKKCV